MASVHRDLTPPRGAGAPVEHRGRPCSGTLKAVPGVSRMMSEPVIVVNHKTYPSASGEASVALGEDIARAAEETGVRFVSAVSAFDLAATAQVAGLEVWSQHVDAVDGGSRTGWLDPALAVARGARGTLLNHSEHRLPVATIETTLDLLPPALPACVCTESAREAKVLARLKPAYLAIEPPELIGGDISVTSADPGIVSDSVAAVKQVAPDVRVLCGAGVKTGDDVAGAIDLGAEGVLLASGVTKAPDPYAVCVDLVRLL